MGTNSTKQQQEENIRKPNRWNWFRWHMEAGHLVPEKNNRWWFSAMEQVEIFRTLARLKVISVLK